MAYNLINRGLSLRGKGISIGCVCQTRRCLFFFALQTMPDEFDPFGYYIGSGFL